MLLALLQAAQTDPNWNDEVITKATIVIAAATVLALVANVLLWLTTRRSTNLTRDMFEAGHRPYVGVTGVEMYDPDKDEDDEDETSEDEDDDPPKMIIFAVEYGNVGTVPAHNVHPTMTIVVDGVVLPEDVREEEDILFVLPGGKQYLQDVIDDPKQLKSVMGAKVLSVIFKCTYEGLTNKQYRYEVKVTYEEKHGDFRIVRATST